MRLIVIFIILALVVMSCGPAPVDKNKPGEKLIITVSVLPQKYFVQRIMGDRPMFAVQVMIPPGHSPATYSPTPQQMKGLSEANLYLRIGYIPFETAWMTNISANNPHLKIIDTSVGVDLIKGDEAEEDDKEETEAEAHRGHHHHGGIDPHIWLSPRAVKIQLKHILDAVIEIDPANRESYEKNYQAFLRDIDNADREIFSLLEKCAGKKFMVFHPAWTYFARDYGLEQIPIEIEGKSPSPADMKRIIDTAKQQNLRVVFIQKQFDTHSAQAVADEIGGRVVPMDPLAEDWLENIRQTAQAICAAN